MDATFKADMQRAVKTAIARLDNGTVGIGEDCLWQLTVSHIKPTGKVCPGAWAARQTFNEVVREKPFSRFVYRQ